jgi:glycosyltransferase involved in cell wall biosynthesis
MIIGIDGRPLQGRFTGDSTYWRGLVGGLTRLETDDRFIIYLDGNRPKPDMQLPENMEMRTLNAPWSRLWSAWSFPKALRRDKVDVAHVQYTIPPGMPCPTVTTIHDISFKRYPEFFSGKDRMILDRAVKFAATHAARIIAVSQFTSDEIVELYQAAPDRISVIYEGVDDQFQTMPRPEAQEVVDEKYRLQFPYVLTVGVIQPRKNFHRLLEGFAKLKENHDCEHKLVIVGKYGWKESGLERQAKDLGLSDDVVLTGYVPYEDLPALYNAADVFVYPSLYEGFGLPPLEAMACGTPVITGNQASLPEVVGDAGLMVDPFDADAFAEALDRLIFDRLLRAEMFALGLDQATKFSWDKTASETLKIYRQCGA